MYRSSCKSCSSEFQSRHSRQVYCGKECRTQGLKEYKAQWYADNKETLLTGECSHCSDEYEKTRSDQKYCSERCMKTASAHKLAPKRKHTDCLVCEENIEHLSKLAKFCSKKCSSKYERMTKPKQVLARQQTPKMKASQAIRKRMSKLIRGDIRKHHTRDMVGCSYDNLVKHLERQFQDGMSWDNYGDWHIDHIRPLASFNLNNPQDQLMANNYKNLQPLWATENLRKGDRYGGGADAYVDTPWSWGVEAPITVVTGVTLV